MSGELGPQHLVSVVSGDLDAFVRLERETNALVRQWAAQLPKLTLHPNGLLAVLRALEQREASTELVQHWASFVRRGYSAMPSRDRCDRSRSTMHWRQSGKSLRCSRASMNWVTR